MSTASEDSSSDLPQRTSHQPGPLAILAATAMGGVLATRLGKTPLIFAAGAAALALLQQKKTSAPPLRAEPQRLPPSAPPLEIPVQSLPPPALPPLEIPAQGQPPVAQSTEMSMQSQVEQWLSRQISREAQALVMDLAALTVVPREPEDDYRPGSFLLDEFDDISSAAPVDNDFFAALTEPAPQTLPAPAPAPTFAESEPSFVAVEPIFAEVEPSFAAEEPIFPEVQAEQGVSLTPPEELPQTLPPPPLFVADAAWTLGVDPMPSLNEDAPHATLAEGMVFNPSAAQEAPSSDQEAPRSNMFSTAPVQMEEVEVPPFSPTPVFQGAAFPDEIQVAPTFESMPSMPAPPALEEVAAWEPEQPVIDPAPLAKTAPEIPLEFAADGEASFDPPLAAAPFNPWQPEPDGFPMTPPVAAQPQMAGAVVEAEIILRPRAPTQNAVTAKSKFAPPSFNTHFSDASNDTPPLEEAQFPIPLQSQHEPKPRKTWRSWWRGD